MTKAAASFDFAQLDPMDHEDEVDIDDVDLERFLDLDDSDEIADLVTAMRGADAVAADAGCEAAPARRAERRQSVPVPDGAGEDRTDARGAAAPGRSPERRQSVPVPDAEDPADAPRAARPSLRPAATPARTGGFGLAARRGAREAAPRCSPERGQGAPAHNGSADDHPPAAPLDLAAIARALGQVRMQGRQLVVTCPACEGRAAIVVYANRFKCFGCETTGEENALVRLLTGWDARRVSAWLADARESAGAADVRRPWRLSLFAR